MQGLEDKTIAALPYMKRGWESQHKFFFENAKWEWKHFEIKLGWLNGIRCFYLSFDFLFQDDWPQNKKKGGRALMISYVWRDWVISYSL